MMFPGGCQIEVVEKPYDFKLRITDPSRPFGDFATYIETLLVGAPRWSVVLDIDKPYTAITSRFKRALFGRRSELEHQYVLSRGPAPFGRPAVLHMQLLSSIGTPYDAPHMVRPTEMAYLRGLPTKVLYECAAHKVNDVSTWMALTAYLGSTSANDRDPYDKQALFLRAIAHGQNEKAVHRQKTILGTVRIDSQDGPIDACSIFITTARLVEIKGLSGDGLDVTYRETRPGKQKAQRGILHPAIPSIEWFAACGRLPSRTEAQSIIRYKTEGQHR